MNDSLEVARIQRGHLDNINRLAEEGKLAIAGPMGDDGDVFRRHPVVDVLPCPDRVIQRTAAPWLLARRGIILRWPSPLLWLDWRFRPPKNTSS